MLQQICAINQACIIVNKLFTNRHHKMQETCNNCFGSKICSTTLRQAKTGKHKWRNVITMYFTLRMYCYISALMFNCFFLTKSRVTYFQPETTVASFLHFMVLLFKVLLNHTFLIVTRFVKFLLLVSIQKLGIAGKNICQ